MRKIILKMNELYKYQVIKKLVDTKENKKRAALQLNCSIGNIHHLYFNNKTMESKVWYYVNN